jgi:outer membrane receptor protein involved in Fe transport
VTLLCVIPLRAQDSVLTGRVLDGSGGAVPNAKVTLQTSPRRVTWTDENGSFVIRNVAPGPSLLIAEAPGFAAAIVTVRPGTPASIELEPAPVVQTIEVNAGTFDQIRLDEPVFQTGIVRSDIATRNNRRLSDVVARMPGVFMSGPPGGDKDVRLRGMDKEFSRTQVDGFMIPDGGEKRELQLNRIPSAVVESVRIIRNPTAEYESDGLAGRVDVETRPISERLLVDGRFGTGARTAAGSHRISQAQLTAGQRFHRHFGFMGTFDWLDDILPISRRFVDQNGQVEADDELQPQRSPNFFGNFGLYTERFGDLHIKPIYMNFSSEKERLREVVSPAGALTRREAETETKEQQTFGLTMNHRYARASGLILDIQAGWFGNSERKPRAREIFRILPDGSYTLDRTERDPESKADKTWNFNSAATLPLHAVLWQEWKFGVSLRSRGRNRDRDRFTMRPDGRVTVGGEAKDRYRIAEQYSAAFVQNRIRLTDRLSWTPGLRVERVRLVPQSGFLAAPPRTTVDVNPSAHLLFRASDRLSLRTAVSRGLARPKFDELAPYENIAANKIVTGNPDLQPARAWNFDAGADYATRQITFSVNAFYKRVRGVIEEVGTGEFRQGRDVFQVSNAGDGWTRGIEFEQRLRLPQFLPAWARRFTFWSNQTVLDSELVDSLGLRRRFKEQPRWIANFGGDFTDEKFGTSLSVMANFVSRRFDFKTNGDITSFGGSTSLDAAVYQRLRGPLRFFAEANNLTNRDRNRDEIFARGSPQRRTEIFGRTALAGLQFTF